MHPKFGHKFRSLTESVRSRAAGRGAGMAAGAGRVACFSFRRYDPAAAGFSCEHWWDLPPAGGGSGAPGRKPAGGGRKRARGAAAPAGRGAGGAEPVRRRRG